MTEAEMQAWVEAELNASLLKMLTDPRPVPHSHAGPTAGVTRDAIEKAVADTMTKLFPPPIVTVENVVYDKETRMATYSISITDPARNQG